MNRWLTAALGVVAVAAAARAHFVFVVPQPGGTARVVLSEDLNPDENVPVEKYAGTKLTARDAAGKDTPVPCAKGEHCLTATLPAGARVVFGTTDYGVFQRGEGKPFRLLYHPKAVLGPAAGAPKVGEAVPVELVPAAENGKVAFTFLAGGKPAVKAEVTVLVPGKDKAQKVTTDGEGRTPAFDAVGRYAAWARHAEAKSGEHGGKKYDEVRHYATVVADLDPAPLPVAVSSFGAAVAGDFVYVYGGHCGRTHTYSTDDVVGTFRRLKLSAPTKWEDLPGGPALQGLALAEHRGQLIRVGGMEARNKPGTPADTHSTASVARFDPATNRWDDLPPLPEGRSSHDAVMVGDTLYVVGGWRLAGGKGTWLTTALALDLAAKEPAWRTVEQPFKRRALTAAAFRGQVYAVGGLEDGGAELHVNIYDPVAKSWRRGPNLPGNKSNGFSPAAAVAGDRLYVALGDGKLVRLSAAGDAWEEAGELAQRRMVARVVPLPGGRLLALGGASRQGPVALSEVLAP